MFTPLLNFISTLFNWLVEHAWKPFANWVAVWWQALFFVIFAIFATVKTLVQFLVDAVALLATKLGELSAISQGQPDFSAANAIMAKINLFFPLSELFALLTVSMGLWAFALTIRFVKWVKELVIA